MIRRHEQDRMALIAFADGMQQVTLPSYEEALRDGVNINHTGNSNNNSANNTNNSLGFAMENGSSQAAAAFQAAASSSALPVSETVLATTELDENNPAVISASQVSTMSASHILYACANTSNVAIPTSSCSNTHPHYSRQGRYRPNAAGTVSSSRSRSRQQHHQRSRDLEAVDSSATVHAWPSGSRPPTSSGGRNGGRNARGNAGSSISSGGSPRDHDALSDTVSHHSVSSAGINWSGQRQPSQAGSSSLRSGSAASVEGNGSLILRDPASSSILSKEPSESTLTTTESAGGNSSQTPSCRALAGSLASFDTSSIVNTEGTYILPDQAGDQTWAF